MGAKILTMKLNPKAKWLFFWSNFVGFLILGSVLSLFVLPKIFELIIENEQVKINLLISLVPLTTIYFICAFLLSYLIGTLRYHAFSFEIEPKRIIIKKGILLKKIIAIPYNRIQNVDILRNIPCRILGLSVIKIQTAGISGAYLAEGVLPGVTASSDRQLRDQVMEKIQEKQGL